MEERGITTVYIEDEVQRSYLDYAMSVIIGRALPDVRDGLKPVQRRILYAMYEAGLFSNRPFKKSATVVGDVLGKYHPHGDMAVYDALARMAQDFSLRYPLIDGQGNFGSIDGDAPAAYRYTEARLTKLAEELLRDLDKDTVDFTPNFDGRLKEPKVLPANIPNLLLNGASGIAVGMATNIPPHNFKELVNGLVALIDNPDLDVDDLLKYIKGPDFPTGGVILGKEGIYEAYRTGKGKVIIRGKFQVEEIKGGKKRIVITEIPPQLNKSNLISKIALMVKAKRIEGVSDLRDESDREGIRIVLELKRDTEPKVVLNQLYYNTPLQTTYGIILLGLVDNTPRVLNLLELCKNFLDFRYQTVFRRTEFELKKASKRAHILEGLKKALSNIDRVIELIKKSKDSETAKEKLIKEFELTETQATAILEMKLARLTSLEQGKIEEEYLFLIKEISRLENLLSSRQSIMEVIKKELLSLREKFGDDRRTMIIEGEVEELMQEDLIAEEEVAIIITNEGYIKRMPVSLYKRQLRGGTGRIGMIVSERDFVKGILTASTHDYLLFFTDRGRCYWLKVYDIPEGSYQSRGRSIVNLLELEKEERITSYLAISEFVKGKFIFMITKSGKVKKVSLEEFSHPRRKGILSINLDEGDELIHTLLLSGKEDIMLISSQGKALRFSESLVRPMGRMATGVKGMSLRKGDNLIGGVSIKEEEMLLLINKKGLGKRVDYKTFLSKGRGGMGMICAKISQGSGPLIKALGVKEKDEIILITKLGTVLRLKVSEIRKQGRNTVGVRLIKLRENDEVVDATRVSYEE